MEKTWLITSLDTVLCEGWYINASMTSFGVICLVMYNPDSEQCHVRFFDDEKQANKFVEQTIGKQMS